MESFGGCINDGTRIETTYQAARIGIALWHEDLQRPIITYDWDGHRRDCHDRWLASLVGDGSQLLREDGLTPNCHLPGDRIALPFNFLQKMSIKNQD